LAAVDAAAISLEAALARAASSGTGVTGGSGVEPTPGLAVDPDGAAGAAAVVTALLTVSDYRDRRAAQPGVRVVAARAAQTGVRPVPGLRVVAARVREVGGTVPCRQATCASAALSRQAESLPSSFDEDHAPGSRLRVYAKLGCMLAVFVYQR